MNPTPTTTPTPPEIGPVPTQRPRPAEAHAIPPLEPGDHLTLVEFKRRFDAMPGLKRAELIEGVVYMSSPVRWKQHAQPHLLVSYWLATYMAATPWVQGGDNASMRSISITRPSPTSPS